MWSMTVMREPKKHHQQNNFTCLKHHDVDHISFVPFSFFHVHCVCCCSLRFLSICNKKIITHNIYWVILFNAIAITGSFSHAVLLKMNKLTTSTHTICTDNRSGSTHIYSCTADRLHSRHTANSFHTPQCNETSNSSIPNHVCQCQCHYHSVQSFLVPVGFLEENSMLRTDENISSFFGDSCAF